MKKYYRIMLGKGGSKAEECYNLFECNIYNIFVIVIDKKPK